jgi:elongation factor Ts
MSAALIKTLRERTGAGMMDCKKALDEAGGDTEKAIDWLRKKGLSSAAKKSDRIAAEGLVAIATAGNKGAMIELNAETDFVARNDQFQQLVTCVATKALDGANSVQALLDTKLESGKNVKESITDAIATIGENMNLRRNITLDVSQGVVASYIHNAIKPGLGKIGVLVALESTASAEALTTLGKQIAMHVAAAHPESLNRDSVDQEKLERERTVLRDQALASGKPEQVVEKMIEGRIRKYYQEIVLLDQLFVIDGKTKISEVVEEAAKEAGTPITIKAFERFALGEGIEKKEDDFAAEVAKVAGAA